MELGFENRTPLAEEELEESIYHDILDGFKQEKEEN